LQLTRPANDTCSRVLTAKHKDATAKLKMMLKSGLFWFGTPQAHKSKKASPNGLLFCFVSCCKQSGKIEYTRQDSNLRPSGSKPVESRKLQ